MKKVTSAFTALCIMLTLLAGCATGSDGGAAGSEPAASSGTPESSGQTAEEADGLLPITKEVTELGFMLGDRGESVPYNYEDSLFYKEMLRRTNIKYNFQPVSNNDYADKFRTTLVSGDYPDIMIVQNKEHIRNGISEGLFFDFSPYLDQMPNFVNAIQMVPDGMKNVKEDNGSIYYVPRIKTSSAATTRSLDYRKDIFDQHGLSLGGTFEQFYRTLEQLKTLYPESTPLMSCIGTGIIDNMFGYLFETPYAIGYDYWNTQQYIYGPITDNYKAMLIYLNKLFAEGLLNKDFLTCSRTDFQKAVINNTAFVHFAYSWFNTITLTDAGRKENNNPEFTWWYGDFPSYTGEPGKIHSFFTLDINGKVFSAKTKHPEAIVKLLDYMFTEDYLILQEFGVEGETFEYGADGQPQYTSNIKPPDDSGNIIDQFGKSIKLYGLIDDNNTVFYSPGMQERLSGPHISEKLDYYRGNNLPDPPYISFTAEDTAKLSGFVQAFTYVEEMTYKFIMGTESLDRWDAYVKQVNDFHIDEAVAIYNQALERYKNR